MLDWNTTFLKLRKDSAKSWVDKKKIPLADSAQTVMIFLLFEKYSSSQNKPVENYLVLLPPPVTVQLGYQRYPNCTQNNYTSE